MLVLSHYAQTAAIGDIALQCVACIASAYLAQPHTWGPTSLTPSLEQEYTCRVGAQVRPDCSIRGKTGGVICTSKRTYLPSFTHTDSHECLLAPSLYSKRDIVADIS